MAMKLKPLINDTDGQHIFCGPTAMAAITGRKVSKVLDALRVGRWGRDWKRSHRECYGYRRSPQIKGTYAGQMSRAFDHLGFIMYTEPFAKPMTLDRFAQLKRGSEFAYLIEVKHHWIAFAGGKVADTSTKGVPVKVADFKGRADPMLRVWRVYRRTR